jgi:hypothetical protein
LLFGRPGRYVRLMKIALRSFAALVAVGLAFALVPASKARGGDDCVAKCKNLQAACDNGCKAQETMCVAKCGGPPPIGSQKCNDACHSTQTNCGNACQANETGCEGKCLLPVP